MLLLGAPHQPLARSIMCSQLRQHSSHRKHVDKCIAHGARGDQSATTTLRQSKSVTHHIMSSNSTETKLSEPTFWTARLVHTSRAGVVKSIPKSNLNVSVRCKSHASQHTHSLIHPSRRSPVTPSTLSSGAPTRAASVHPLEEVRSVLARNDLKPSHSAETSRCRQKGRQKDEANAHRAERHCAD